MLNLRFSHIASPGKRVLGRWLTMTALHLVILQLTLLAPAWSAQEASATSTAASTQILAQADSADDPEASRPLEPRYPAREVEKKSGYNGSYIFALTRSLTDSTIAPAGKAPLFLFTVPLDIALLPLALIGGLFG